jgi:hypothetical protein
MHIRVRIRCDAGRWSVKLPPCHDDEFTADSLAEAFDYAKHACAAAPAVIELFGAEGYVVSVVQDRGWPLPVCVAEARQINRRSRKFAQILRRLSRLFPSGRSRWRALPPLEVPSSPRLRSRKIARGPWHA